MADKKEKQPGMKDVLYTYGSDKKYLYYIVIITGLLTGITRVLPYFILYGLIRDIVLHGTTLGIAGILQPVIWLALTQLAGAIMAFISQHTSHVLAFRVERNMRAAGMRHLMKLPIGFIQNEDTGRLRRILDDNASKTHSYLAHNFPDATASMVAPVVLIVSLLVVDIRLGLICLATVGLTLISFKFMFGEKTRNRMMDFGRSAERLNVAGVEYIRGIPVVKVFNQSVESFQKFSEAIDTYDGLARGLVFGWRLPMVAATVSLYLGPVILGPVTLLMMRGAEDPVELMLKGIYYILISFLLYTAVMGLMTVSESKNQFLMAMGGLNEILTLQPQEKKEETKGRDARGIVMENVTFCYPNRTDAVLKNISYHFEYGKSYALVGASGSGKSTLLKLMARLYDVTEGTVYVNGRDVVSMAPEELLQQMAIVFQETSLLKASLRENVTMGCPATDEAIMQALRDACCEDILARMPDGLATFIGTGGTFVSGGEAQRIALARAFLKGSDILLLDEASAYADAENEAMIAESLERLKGGRLTVSIAHRLSSIRDADEIIVLKDGRIEAAGSHEMLMANCDIYRNLYEEYSGSVAWQIETSGGLS
ncbi:MAG: ABC transporter ATP-binding protein [Eubacteriales bacterium]|nr:ABC transporter ATP-binding protein [Eubacteriales bacterium]